MQLIILGSDSSGNSYVLKGQTCSLILECGLPIKEVKKSLNFDLSRVAGALITHSHGDHAKYANQYMSSGINVCSSLETLNTLKCSTTHRMRVMKAQNKYEVGEFVVMPFAIEHDAPEPFGYLIKHPECGLVLFVTDTCYLKYKFPGLNQIIIECNYSQDIVDKRMNDGDTISLVRNRVITSHMSFETCKEVLRANDLKQVNNIVLIHLSDSNSDSKLFKSEIESLTGKTVNIAESGMVIDFNLQPF